jgi:Sulfatase
VLLDALMRGLPLRRAIVGRAFGAVASLALWTLAWSYRKRPVVRLVAAALAALVLTVDIWIYRYYGSPLDRQVVVSAVHNWADVRPIALRVAPWMVLMGLALGSLEYACLLVNRPAIADGRWLRPSLLLACLTGAILAPRDLTPPDLRALGALALVADAMSPATISAHEAFAAPARELPVLPSRRPELPNVFFILSESVRAQTYCSEARPDCLYTPDLDQVLPDRIPLRQMRSVASYTAIAAAALLTGRTEGPPRGERTVAPTVFDYARAVRLGDTRLTTAYWSAQSASVLERDVRGAVDSWTTLETLLGHSVDDEDDVVELDMDTKLAAYLTSALPGLQRPFVLVAHFLGTHAPYYVDETNAPFRPVSHVAGWGSLPELQNAYRDAVVAQDRAVAACVAAFLAVQGGSPWLIVFTSDHGEAFGEHGAIHHGQNLYDEQIHVPAWIAEGGGALSAEQRARLLARRDAYVTHLDILPTILDALGVWEGIPLGGERSHFLGQSLFGASLVPSAVPITNCTELFPCPLNAWGVLWGDHVLEGQAWDGDWNCVDLASQEEHTRGPACDALSLASKSFFPTLPNGRLNADPP